MSVQCTYTHIPLLISSSIVMRFSLQLLQHYNKIMWIAKAQSGSFVQTLTAPSVSWLCESRSQGSSAQSAAELTPCSAAPTSQRWLPENDTAGTSQIWSEATRHRSQTCKLLQVRIHNARRCRTEILYTNFAVLDQLYTAVIDSGKLSITGLPMIIISFPGLWLKRILAVIKYNSDARR